MAEKAIGANIPVVAERPVAAERSVGQLIKSYFFWTYERGSLHYDVMVTLILVFMFVSPRFINYKDRPVETVALHASEVLVKEAGTVGGSSQFVYQIRQDEVGEAKTDAELKAAILRVVEPISGEVTLKRYEVVKDAQGRVIAYDAWVVR
jgi:hypothetical protein